MSFIGFPLRIQNGFLSRSGEVEAILALLRLMASTPAGSWRGCTDFGVRDLFEGARTQPDAPKIAAEKMNRALQDLEIKSYRVDAIVPEPSTDRDVDSYMVTIVSAADDTRSYSALLNP